jgi:CRP-like cAMP-binding protein
MCVGRVEEESLVANQELLVDPLRQVALFDGLTPSQLAEIAKLAERIVFKPGETIIEDGRDGGAAILVVSGEAEVLRSYTDEPAAVEAGSLLSEMSMFIDTEASATIVAKSAVRALRLERGAMLEQMTTDPTLADHFVAMIAGRLRNVADELRKVDKTLAGEPTIETDWVEVPPGRSEQAGREAHH